MRYIWRYKSGRFLFLAFFLSLLAWRVLAVQKVISTATCVATASATTLTSVMSVSNTPRRGWEIQNNGPNAIWCRDNNDTPASGTGRKLVSGAAWAADQSNNNGDTLATVKCIAETALQVTPACTTFSEAF